MDEEHRTQGATVETRVRKNITVTEDLFDAFMDLKREDETQGMLVQRMIESVRDFDELGHNFDKIESDHAANSRQIDVLHDTITELEEQLEDLRSGAETALIPGEQSFSIKDAMASLKDVCDDDTVCIKFAAKIMEEQAKAANSHLDREHSAEQKRLDREDKDKDRALKKELAESRTTHDKEMTMIKKGMVSEKDLEGIVFLGQKNTSPADRINNAKELAARQAAREDEEFGDVDPPGEDPAHD